MKTKNLIAPARMQLTLAVGVLVVGLLVSPGCGSKLYAHSALADSGSSEFAELTIIREKELAAGALALEVRIDGAPIAKLRTGRYAVVRLKPGVYGEVFVKAPGLGLSDLDTDNWTAGTHNLEMKAGERYYLLVESVGLAGLSSTPIFGVHTVEEGHARRLMAESELVGGD
jgi:hypothetical protein